jgi:hypothetical protein
MRNLLLTFLLLAAALATACGPNALEDEARSALPTKDAVALPTPGGATAANALAVGSPSDYYQLTYNLSNSVNGGVGAVLLTLQAIVAQPATSCTAESCTWGPGSKALDPNTYELVVTKQPTTPVGYQYVLSAQPKSNTSAAFTAILSGTAVPGSATDHGSGNFTIDFNAAQQLENPGSTIGELSATYDNNGPLQLQVTFLGMADTQTPSQLDDAAYAYADNSSGGGDLQIAFTNTTTNGVVTLHSRWQNDGSGRGDATYADPTYNATASECWSSAFEVTFWESSDPSNPSFGPNSGQESACDYIGAVTATLQAP